MFWNRIATALGKGSIEQQISGNLLLLLYCQIYTYILGILSNAGV